MVVEVFIDVNLWDESAIPQHLTYATSISFNAAFAGTIGVAKAVILLKSTLSA